MRKLTYVTIKTITKAFTPSFTKVMKSPQKEEAAQLKFKFVFEDDKLGRQVSFDSSTDHTQPLSPQQTTRCHMSPIQFC